MAEKYIVLTNKDTFQTVLDNKGLEIVETYHFYFIFLSSGYVARSEGKRAGPHCITGKQSILIT